MSFSESNNALLLNLSNLALSEAYAHLWPWPVPLSCTSHFLPVLLVIICGDGQRYAPPVMFVSIIPPSETMSTCYSPLHLWWEENPEYTQGSHENTFTLFFFPKSWLRSCKFLWIVSLSHLHRGFWSGVTTGQARNQVCRIAARNVFCFAFFLCFFFPSYSHCLGAMTFVDEMRGLLGSQNDGYTMFLQGKELRLPSG